MGLTERGLVPIHCPQFEKMGKEWVLYGRDSQLSLALENDGSAPPKKKGRPNAFASRLAGRSLRGPAVIGPVHRDWRPTIMGRMDMLSGLATKRNQLESETKTVTREAV